MVLYGIIWYYILLHCIVWYGEVWYGMVLLGILLHCMVWYGIVWYIIVLYDIVWYDRTIIHVLCIAVIFPDNVKRSTGIHWQQSTDRFSKHQVRG